jgi:uncharacterized protein YxjI
MAPLLPFNPPLGPNPAYCFPDEITLHMKEKTFSLTGDDFTVKTVAGMEVCKCKGKPLSLSHKKGTEIAKNTMFEQTGTTRAILIVISYLIRNHYCGILVFTDMQNHELFALKNKHLTIHPSFHAEAPNGHDLFVVQGHFSLLSSRSTVEFTNAADGRPVELEVKGDWLDRSASITCGGTPVAHIARSFFNLREIFADKETVSHIHSPRGVVQEGIQRGG